MELDETGQRPGRPEDRTNGVRPFGVPLAPPPVFLPLAIEMGLFQTYPGLPDETPLRVIICRNVAHELQNGLTC